MIRKLTPNFASAWAHMRPAGPAPITRTSTLDSLDVEADMVRKKGCCRCVIKRFYYLYERLPRIGMPA
jgi:hypothetical protein